MQRGVKGSMLIYLTYKVLKMNIVPYRNEVEFKKDMLKKVISNYENRNRINGRPRKHLTKLDAVESVLNSYLDKGLNVVTIRQVRDSLKGIAVFNNTQGIHSLIKNEILPILIKKGLCELNGTTIILKGDSNV